VIAQLDPDYLRARPLKAVTRVLSWALFEGRPVTTRGRWINPFVFGLLAVARRLPVRSVPSAPLYIVGTGRSGTTILGKVLSLHPDVGFLNEPKAMWHAAVPGEDVIGSYDRGPARFRMDADDVTPDAVRALRRMFGVYAAVTGVRRIVDKYPELVFRVPLVRRVFPDARFIFLVRDGFDTVRSIDQWSDRLGVDEGDEVHDWWGVDDRKWRLMTEELVPADPELGPVAGEIRSLDAHRDRAATEWIVTMREGLSRRDEHPEAFRMVRYEDLTRHPAETVAGLLQWSGLPEDRATLEYAGRTLHPVPRKEAVPLSSCIEPAFLAMMARLGYRRGEGSARSAGRASRPDPEIPD